MFAVDRWKSSGIRRDFCWQNERMPLMLITDLGNGCFMPIISDNYRVGICLPYLDSKIVWETRRLVMKILMMSWIACDAMTNGVLYVKVNDSRVSFVVPTFKAEIEFSWVIASITILVLEPPNQWNKNLTCEWFQLFYVSRIRLGDKLASNSNGTRSSSN